MPITYPLSMPAAPGFKFARFAPRSVVAGSASPFTGQQQVYVHQGQWWMVELELPPMRRAVADYWVSFLLSLNGREGTFLLGDPDAKTPRGTWSGTPLINGASQTGDVIAVDGLTAGATAKAGDYFQLGDGLGAHLHKVLQDATANGSGQAALTIWPSLRASPDDNAPLVTSSAKGLFRMTSNDMSWSTDQVSNYGLNFSCIEAL